MQRQSRILIAGRQSLIGHALAKRLTELGFERLFASEPDYTRQADVDRFFQSEKPEYVFVVGGKSGGISANVKYPAELMYDNLQLVANPVHAAHVNGVTKLLYLASSCSYPKLCAQPMCVDQLLAGPLEPTNEPYALAKIAGIKLCQSYRTQYGSDFIVAIPANMFGPGDDFRPEDSHVIAALMRRMHEAKQHGHAEVTVWGTGTPRREFVAAEDVADACVFLMNEYSSADPINIGGGADLSIRELAELIRGVVGYTGELVFDRSKPDGMPLKSVDASTLLAMGWRPRRAFRDVLAEMYRWYLQEEEANVRLANV